MAGEDGQAAEDVGRVGGGEGWGEGAGFVECEAVDGGEGEVGVEAENEVPGIQVFEREEGEVEGWWDGGKGG